MYAGLSLSEPEAGHIVSSTHTWSHCLSQKLVTLSEPEAGQDFFDVLRKPRNELPLLRVEPVAMFLPSQLGKLLSQAHPNLGSICSLDSFEYLFLFRFLLHSVIAGGLLPLSSLVRFLQPLLAWLLQPQMSCCTAPQMCCCTASL